MKKSILFAIFSLFAFLTPIIAETVHWMVDGAEYATTSCETGNDMVLPTQPSKEGYTFMGWREIANRGTFATWADVPTNTNLYLTDGQTSIPQEYDVMIVTDADAYPVGDFATSYRIVVTGGGVNNNTRVETFDIAGVLVDTVTYLSNIGKTINICGDNVALYVDGGAAHGWNFDASKNVKYDNVFYFSGERVKRILRGNSDTFTIYVNEDNPTPLSGSWRFVYHGDWATDGKYGWKPVEQIE